MPTRFLRPLLAIAIFLLSFSVATGPAWAAVTDWQKGGSISPASSSDFASASFQQSLRNLAAIHANYVTLIIPYHQSNIWSTDIQPGWDTPTDASLIAAIHSAHLLGLHVMLKPHIDPYDGQWRANINPSDRNGWFANYDKM
ncbi:hypothetical protein KGQ71_01935, partial [Patescibacteria group bacterium]|nr:hypothetical protein [Patescibacteria group bacterium]